MSNWASYKISMLAELDGTPVDVIQASVNYEMNTIPTATLLLPLGRSSRGTSPVHTLIRQLKVLKPAKLTLTMKKIGADGGAKVLDPPAETMVIFEGYVAGIGYDRLYKNVVFRVELVHWLSDLSFSSALSVSMHPSSPAHYTTAAVNIGGDSGASNWSTLSNADTTLLGMEEDLWELGFKKWLLKLSDLNTVFISELNVDSGSKNTAARKALERMSSKDKPLSITLDANQTLITALISTDAVKQVGNPENVAQLTFWDIIVGRFAADYLFSIVPRPNDALVVPFVGGIRKIHKTIKVTDIVGAGIQARLDRPLRAVGVLAPIMSDSGGVGSPQPTPQDMGCGGYYEPSDADELGMILIRQAPRWISALEGVAWANDSTPGNDPVSSSMHPGEGTTPSPAPGDQRKQDFKTQKQFLDRYATTLFGLENLKNRQGTVSGALRFDIAPGSSVQIESGTDKFVSDDGLAIPLIGQVVRVSYHFDVEQGQAGTAFHIAYVRNQAENESDKTSTATHPMFDQVWAGADLIEG